MNSYINSVRVCVGIQSYFNRSMVNMYIAMNKPQPNKINSGGLSCMHMHATWTVSKLYFHWEKILRFYLKV